MSTRKEIASQLRTARIEKGYSQAKVSRETGVGLRTVVNAESAKPGDTWPNLRQVTKLAEFLGLKISLEKEVQ